MGGGGGWGCLGCLFFFLLRNGFCPELCLQRKKKKRLLWNFISSKLSFVRCRGVFRDGWSCPAGCFNQDAVGGSVAWFSRATCLKTDSCWTLAPSAAFPPFFLQQVTFCAWLGWHLILVTLLQSVQALTPNTIDNFYMMSKHRGGQWNERCSVSIQRLQWILNKGFKLWKY